MTEPTAHTHLRQREEHLLSSLRVVPGGQNQAEAERVETKQRAKLGLDHKTFCCPACTEGRSPCPLRCEGGLVTEAVAEDYMSPLTDYAYRDRQRGDSVVSGICLASALGLCIFAALWLWIGWRTLILAALIAVACGVGLWIGTRGED